MKIVRLYRPGKPWWRCWHTWHWASDRRAKWCCKCGRALICDEPMTK